MGKQQSALNIWYAGIPFMVSDFLIQDVLDKWSCGVSVDVANMDEIVQNAVYLMESPGEAAKMGELGKAAYGQEYNWENEEEKFAITVR